MSKKGSKSVFKALKKEVSIEDEEILDKGLRDTDEGPRCDNDVAEIDVGTGRFFHDSTRKLC